MKKLIYLLFAAVLLSSCNRVEPNSKGVLERNYGQNGRSDYEIVTGNQGILGFGTTLYQVPGWIMSADPQSMTVLSKDNGSFTVDPTFQYYTIGENAVDIIYQYKQFGGKGEEMMDNVEQKVLSPLVLDSYRTVARTYSTDSLMFNMGRFEKQVEDTVRKYFRTQFMELKNLTSGLTPPQSMIDAIERRNNAKVQAQQVENEKQTAIIQQEKARIEQTTNQIISQGLTKEILLQQWIEALKTTNNKVIITDGNTPVFLQQ